MTSARSPSGRGRPIAQDLPARKERLVAVAAEVFAREGYGQTSFAAIAREAKVSVKTIYAWFDGKAGLFRAVTNHFARTIEPAARAILAEAESPAEALPRAAELVLGFVLSPSLLAFQRAVIGASAELPAIGGEFNRNGPLRGHLVMSDYFARCHREGSLDVPDADVAVDSFMGLVFGDAHRSHLIDATLPPPSPAEINRRAERAAALFLRLYQVKGN